MSYTPTTWQTGDVITAEKLNHMESGIAEGGGGFFVINASNVSTTDTVSTPTFDKTLEELSEAMNNGLTPVVVYSPAGGPSSYAVNCAYLSNYTVGRESGAVEYAAFTHFFTEYSYDGNTTIMCCCVINYGTTSTSQTVTIN